MLTIPAAIQTLLTSKMMVGDNRPTGTLTIADMPTGGSMVDPTVWTDWITFLPEAAGNMTETSDGRAIIWFVDGDVIKIAFSDTVVGILNQTESFTSVGATTIATLTGAIDIQGTLTLLDGKLHLILYYLPAGEEYSCKAEYWRDVDGTGASWSKISDIATDVNETTYKYVSFKNQLNPSLLHKLGDGTYVVTIAYNILISISTRMTVRAYYSSDQGATWTPGGKFIPGYYVSYAHSLNYLLISDTSFAITFSSSSGWTGIGIFTNSGADVAVTDCDMSTLADWYEIGGDVWLFSYNEIDKVSIYRYAGADRTAANLGDLDNWTHINDIACDTSAPARLVSIETSDALILQHAVGDVISGAAVILEPPDLLPIKAITIDRSKGTASQATVVLDNKLGIYAPDSIGAWNHIIWPNKVITITLGYGAEQQLVFTGLIDEVFMSTYPGELTITARDYSKLALDQIAETVIGGVTTYSFAYTNQTPEAIFTAMATQAGWAAGDIHADVTGITLTEFLTGHESIADCFQRLCEITGWEWFCDEGGDVYFRAATDPAAVSVYSFTEGVDIFSLDYRISDAELYRNIVVWTSDANGSTIKASGVWGAADYNNILPKYKVQTIHLLETQQSILIKLYLIFLQVMD